MLSVSLANFALKRLPEVVDNASKSIYCYQWDARLARESLRPGAGSTPLLIILKRRVMSPEHQVLGHHHRVRTVALAGASCPTRGKHGPMELGETDGYGRNTG